MKVRVKYFARYREALGLSEEIIEFEQSVNVAEILSLIRSRGGKWQHCFDSGAEVLSAINHEIVSAENDVKDGDELAIYPPVTGG